MKKSPLLLAIGLLAACLQNQNAQHQARPAEEFVESIGVNGSGVTNIPVLTELGIRHLRNSKLAGFDNSINAQAYNQLGVRFISIAQSYYAEQPGQSNFGQGLAQQPAGATGLPAGAIVTIEGINEPNFFYAVWAGLGGENGAAAWQNDYYPFLKNAASTRGIPVANYSIGNISGVPPNRPLYSYDFQNLHDYTGSQPPLNFFERNLGWLDAQTGDNPPPRPLLVTEWGFSTLTGADYPVTEKTQAKYILRGFADYFRKAVIRSYAYSLFDTDQRYGWIRGDGSRKPSFHAVKNLIAIVQEAGWNSSSKQWSTPVFQAGALDYTPTSSHPRLRSLLLQKSNGTFHLLLWLDVASAAPSGPTTLAPDYPDLSAPVTFRLGTAIQSAALRTLQADGSFASSALTISNNGGFQVLSNVPVTDGLCVLELVPVGGLAATQNRIVFNRQEIAINAGGPAAGSFLADAWGFSWDTPVRTAFDGETIPELRGGTYTHSQTVATNGVADPAPASVYQSGRFGNLTYAVPDLIALAPYRVRLHFAETNSAIGAGGRKFNVQVNGRRIASNLDVFSAAGGLNRAFVLETTTFADLRGRVFVQCLTGDAETPILNGIEILSAGFFNGGFEAPELGPGLFTYGTGGAGWAFAGGSGIAANSSGFTHPTPDAPEGNQVAFLQGNAARATQSLFFHPGTYRVKFQSAQRSTSNNGGQDIRVEFAGTALGVFKPAGAVYSSFVSQTFTVAQPGFYEIAFQGLNSAGGDNTAFVDAVEFVSEGPATLSGLFASGVDHSGQGLAAGSTDPHFTIITRPGGGGTSAVVHQEIWPVGPAWLANSAASKWIAPAADQGAQPGAAGTYVYRTTFQLTGNPAAARLNVRIAADDRVSELRINGYTVPGSASAGFQNWSNLVIDSGFAAGTNTLDIVLVNDGTGANPTGLRVELSDGGAAPVKFPATNIIGTSGSWNNDPNRTKERAFDQNLNTFFDAPDPGNFAWAGLDLGTPRLLRQVKFAPRTGLSERMVGGKFQVSSTADFSANVLDVFTISQTPPEGVLSVQNISAGAAYRYVRYLAPSGGYGNVAELEFWGN
ncbi:MAG: malectin domain-containing carbohydrate-binding protein [Terrimicrobiaceae bacterium]|nr:malectin domain-containing carbohydrate-binding protein [Terrimicrobiaceae bacterium]